MEEKAIEALADEAGIARSYKDVNNREVIISTKARAETLKLMGYALDGSDASQIEERKVRLCQNMLESVSVLNDKDFPFIYIRTRADIRENAVITWTFELENGERITRAEPIEEIEIARFYEVRALLFQETLLCLTAITISAVW